MSGAKNIQSLKNLKSALERLQEALQEPEINPLAVDGTLQRFEFVIELFGQQGTVRQTTNFLTIGNSPQPCIKEPEASD